MKRVVSMKVLPGEPLDGTGAVCVHLLVRDDASRFVEPHGLHPVVGEDGKPRKQELSAAPTRMCLACDPARDYRPQTRGGVTTVTPRSEDPRVVNCPKCKKTRRYAALMAEYDALNKGTGVTDGTGGTGAPGERAVHRNVGAEQFGTGHAE